MKLSKAKFSVVHQEQQHFDSIVESAPPLVMKEKKEVKEVESNFSSLFDG